MMALLRSEIRKATGTRLAWGLLLAALAIVALALGFTLWGPDAGGVEVQGASASVETSADVISLLGVTNILGVFALLFGVVFTTGEYRHRTASTTFLTEPRRWRVVVAKLGIAAGVAVVYTAITLALALAVLAVFAATQDAGLPMDADVWTFLGMTTAAVVLNAVIGVGVGAALRSQVAAIVAVLVWLFVIESLVGGLLPALARWTPFAATNNMTVLHGDTTIAVATALAVGYAALAMGAGTWLTERRDTP